MARTTTVDNTDIYRALVTYFYGFDLNEKKFQTAYGPHDSKAHARDHDAQYRGGPTRVEKQVLRPQWIVGVGNVLEWVTIETKYTNGGEEVNWDD